MHKADSHIHFIKKIWLQASPLSWWKWSRSWKEAIIFTACFVCQDPFFLECVSTHLYSYIYALWSQFSPLFLLKNKGTPSKLRIRNYGSTVSSSNFWLASVPEIWAQGPWAFSPLHCLGKMAKASEPLVHPWLPVSRTGLCGPNEGNYSWCLLMICRQRFLSFPVPQPFSPK